MALRLCATTLVWAGAAIAMRLADDAAQTIPASWCFTYLSDVMVPVPTWEAGPLPTTTGTQAVISIPSPESQFPSGPPSLSGSLAPPSPSSVLSTETLITTSNSGTSIALNSSPAPSIPAIRQVIFFITPSLGRRRYLHTRASPGFLNSQSSNQQRCDNATVFTLVSGQLSENGGIPIFYTPGDNYKQLRSAGSLPDGAIAITTTFADNNGILEFSNSALPGGRASFCEDDTGHVYMTFTSSPPNCGPVSLASYDGRHCLFSQHPW